MNYRSLIFSEQHLWSLNACARTFLKASKMCYIILITKLSYLFQRWWQLWSDLSYKSNPVSHRVSWVEASGNLPLILWGEEKTEKTLTLSLLKPTLAFCQMDVEYFPFDEQTCVMKFGSWTYDGFQVWNILIQINYFNFENLCRQNYNKWYSNWT